MNKLHQMINQSDAIIKQVNETLVAKLDKSHSIDLELFLILFQLYVLFVLVY